MKIYAVCVSTNSALKQPGSYLVHADTAQRNRKGTALWITFLICDVLFDRSRDVDVFLGCFRFWFGDQ